MTVEDPWATSTPEPEQPAAPAPAPTVVNNASRPAASSEGKVVVTLKGGRDFDAPWIVIHADDLQDAYDQTGNAELLGGLMDRVQGAARRFAGSAPAPAQGGGQQQAPSRPAQREDRTPPGAQQPPDWFPEAPAPDWVYKTGVKNGKAWHAWAPARKGDGEWEFHRPPR